MELFDVMRTTFAAREFTAEPLPDATLFNILDRARFAPSGGNRQGWRVIVVRERATREALAALTAPAAKRYAAQVAAGDSPWNTIDPPSVDAATIEKTPTPSRLTEPVLKAAVVLVVCVDLKVVASTDQHLQRGRGGGRHAARPTRQGLDQAEAQAGGRVRRPRALGRRPADGSLTLSSCARGPTASGSYR